MQLPEQFGMTLLATEGVKKQCSCMVFFMVFFLSLYEMLLRKAFAIEDIIRIKEEKGSPDR